MAWHEQVFIENSQIWLICYVRTPCDETEVIVVQENFWRQITDVDQTAQATFNLEASGALRTPAINPE